MFDVVAKKVRPMVVCLCLTVVFAATSKAALLFQDGFNYSVGSLLSSNSPWGGTAGAALSVAETNLFFTTLRDTIPSGQALKAGVGSGSVALVDFTNIPVTSGDIYCAFLLNVATVPSRSDLVAALLPSGTTSTSQGNDPLDFSLRSATGGFTLSLDHTGLDPISTSTALAVNTTHLIVLKYTFGGYGQVGVYVDPVPGAAEPAPDASSNPGDDDGSDAPNLQVLLLSATGSSGQGAYTLDTLRIGTAWADVTPVGLPVTISGPADQAICSGSPATFAVTATGSPPLFYQWRTNGVDVPNETNASYTLPNAGAAESSLAYDVVVNGPYGSATSAPASLSLSYQSPQIVVQPSNAIAWPGVTDATFVCSASGDAPLAYQWRINGVAITNATNASYALTNLNAADSTNVFDVVVSNPCGTAASSPARVLFAHLFLPSEALPAFFSGLNLVTTNTSGQALFAWSSSDPSLLVNTWFLEGQLSEQPLNDGSGKSIYSINVTPATSLVYYVIGPAVSGPYVSPTAVNSIATDSMGNYTFAVNNYPITDAGLIILPGAPPPVVIQSSPAGVQVTGLTAPNATIWLQCASSLTPPINWVTIATNIAAADGSINFSDTITGTTPGKFYRLVLP